MYSNWTRSKCAGGFLSSPLPDYTSLLLIFLSKRIQLQQKLTLYWTSQSTILLLEIILLIILFLLNLSAQNFVFLRYLLNKLEQKKTDSEKYKAVTLSISFSVLATKNAEADKAILLGMYCPWNSLITVEEQSRNFRGFIIV